jgi:signal transduction histidine kinase/DNA-binding response OmpR family regulator
MTRDTRFPISLPELERITGAALYAVAPDGTIAEAGPKARALLGTGAGKPFPGPLREGSLLDVPRAAPLRVHALRLKGRELVLAVLSPSRDDEAEAELVRARAATKAAEAAKSVFLTNMSHELRTPMIGILGMTELTLATSLSRKQREYLEMVRHSAASLLEIINDILDSARITAGRLELAATAFALRETVDSAVTVFAPLAEQKGLTLSARIDPAAPLVVVGDPIRLRQILINLVGNAVKFTDKGSVEVEVTPTKAPDPAMDGPSLRFTVRDTGIGIPAGKLDAIFESFTQADPSPTRKYRGAGLGLSIFKELVTMMGGEIGVESEEGKGSLFSFTVRLGPAGGKALAAAADMDLDAALEHSLPPLTILLAEDNPVNQMFIRELLEQSGHTVIAAHTGLRAVKVLEKSRVDAVLMDIQMPEMDGMEATRIIRGATDGRIDPDVPIIALTAHAHKGDRETFLQAGMDDYLQKPVGLPEISASLARVLTRKGRMTSPAAENPEILDFPWLLEKARGNAAFVLKLCAAFVEEKPGMIAAMRQALADADLEKLAFLAHSLKGASATMGAKTLSTAAKALDTAARSGNRDLSAAALREAEGALNQVLMHMKARMAQYAETSPVA